MTAAGRLLPHGWRDFLFQLSLWLGFGLVYQIARGIADQSPLQAIENGVHVIEAERALNLLVEIDIQRAVMHAGDAALSAVNVTYWLSQFPVLGLALLWIYLFRNEAFVTVRNWIFATNLLALVGYVLLPTAPPRMFPEHGFVDTLAQSAALNHGSGLVELASNPYAAMPSVHSADALIIGFAMAMLVKSRWAAMLWTFWPTWVWFSVMATGNHYWLDIAAGVGVALMGATIVSWAQEGRPSATPALYRCDARRW
ncbi:MAG TPA: phosphatase PAP2 family protein [Gaiellaceae bacterium]|nr:phosphatase PAP2 family protein [Gaiellaceae bacterium]